MSTLKIPLFIFALLVALLLTNGCARIHIHQGRPLSHEEPIASAQQNILLGLYPLSSPVNLEERCPKGWEEIDTRANLLSSVFHLVTLNLYAPWNTKVYCKN